MLVNIDERCSGCGLCISVCPTGAIKTQGNKVILAGECVGCGLCLGECPVKALSLEKPAKNAGEITVEAAPQPKTIGRRMEDDAQSQDTGV
jgi:ferredoxin